MKKFLTVMIAVAMIVSAMCVSVSAGELLYTDDFSDFDTFLWVEEGTKYYIEDGTLMGYNDAVVHQTNYIVDDPDPNDDRLGGRSWETCTASIDVQYLDLDKDGDQLLSLWFTDYAYQYAAGNPAVNTYYFGINAATGVVFVGLNGLAAENLIFETPKAIPAKGEDGDWMNLGFRTSLGSMSFYYNNELVYTVTSETIGQYPSPVILWNQNTWCRWDNFKLGTVDYDMFDEGVVTTPAVTEPGTTVPGESETTAEPVTVVVTDTNGETVTDASGAVLTETQAPANTNKTGTTGGNSTTTGDITAVALAAAIVTLGTAIIVKKVR